MANVYYKYSNPIGKTEDFTITLNFSTTYTYNAFLSNDYVLSKSQEQNFNEYPVYEDIIQNSSNTYQLQNNTSCIFALFSQEQRNFLNTHNIVKLSLNTENLSPIAHFTNIDAHSNNHLIDLGFLYSASDTNQIPVILDYFGISSNSFNENFTGIFFIGNLNGIYDNSETITITVTYISEFTQLTAHDFDAAPTHHTHDNLATLTAYTGIDEAATVWRGGIGKDFTHTGLVKTGNGVYEPLTSHNGTYYSNGQTITSGIPRTRSVFGTLPYEYGGTTATSTDTLKYAIGGKWGQQSNSVWNPNLSTTEGYNTVIVPGWIYSNKSLYFTIPVPQEITTNVIFPTGTTTYSAALGINNLCCWNTAKNGIITAYSGISHYSGLPKLILSSSGNIVIPTQAFSITGTARPVGTTVGTWSSAIEHGSLKYYLGFTNPIATTYATSPATPACASSVCTVELKWVRYNNTYNG